MVEESQDYLRRNVVQLHIYRRLAQVYLREVEEQHERVAVSRYSARAQRPLLGQMLGKNACTRAANDGGVAGDVALLIIVSRGLGKALELAASQRH